MSLPGGCAIGTRPVDLFLYGLQAARRRDRDRRGLCRRQGAKGGLLIGDRYVFPKVSVGATHVLMMAATLAKGATVIENAAREPEIADLAECLVAMGAKIAGIGTPTLTIEGVDELHGATHRGHPRPHRDRHLCHGRGDGRRRRAAAKAPAPSTCSARSTCSAAGRRRDHSRRSGIRVRRNGNGIQPVDVETEPFPGFPTDLQAQFMALMTMAKGESQHPRDDLREPLHARAGAGPLRRRHHVSGQMATVDGVAELKGAQVMATDLRASVSLVIAGLAARGETMVNRVYHLDRGFERLEDKLSAAARRSSGSRA